MKSITLLKFRSLTKLSILIIATQLTLISCGKDKIDRQLGFNPPPVTPQPGPEDLEDAEKLKDKKVLDCLEGKNGFIKKQPQTLSVFSEAMYVSKKECDANDKQIKKYILSIIKNDENQLNTQLSI